MRTFVTTILIILSQVFCLIHGRVLFQNGRAQLCDEENGCPQGYACMYSHFAPSLKLCYAGIQSQAAKPGRCPLSAETVVSSLSSLLPQRAYAAQSVLCGQRCYFDQDCTLPNEKCCFLDKCGRVCTQSLPIDPNPRITILYEGSMVPIGQLGINWRSSMVLVQSQGKNLLWDTGAATQKIPFMKALSERVGLDISDITQILTSHGHLDHVSNVGLFPDTPTNFDYYRIIGSRFLFTPFTHHSSLLNGNKNGHHDAQSSHYFIEGDQNLELLQTPGHTLQDISLLVYNVSGMGTVALVGDLFLSENDGDTWQKFSQEPHAQVENRRKILCLANFVVPGHGQMFQVTEQMRIGHGGCTNGNDTIKVTTVSSTTEMENELPE